MSRAPQAFRESTLKKKDINPIWRGIGFIVIMLGLVLYSAESTAFYLGLEHGTAAAVALIFYAYPAVIAVATEFLRIASWNFIAVGLTFCCSGIFQALGDTRPALISSGTRLLTYVVPAVWLADRPWAVLHDFWYLGVGSLIVQALIAVLLLRHQLHHKLKLFEPHGATT